MKKSRILFIGFMLFSLFFGAGNLIFPPFLGYSAGSNFTPAILGFLFTGVLLPILAILAVVQARHGLISIGSRVHPVFGLLFAVLIYLSIGALYGIPRAANVAYEIGFVPAAGVGTWWTLLLFSVIFFLLTLLLSLNPEKIVDRLGQWLTPILFGTLAILFVRAFFIFDAEPTTVDAPYTSSPFIGGFLEGYLTMDALGALAFGMVIVNSLRAQGASSKRELMTGATAATIVAGLGLSVVYISLGWIGSRMFQQEGISDGAGVLEPAAAMLFGPSGSLFFGVIVFLACLTTCVGLITACSEFFHSVMPRIAYKSFVVLFIIIGMMVTNLGLSLILSIAVPLLVFIYPLAIVLIVLSLLRPLIGEGSLMYQLSMIFTGIFALYEGLSNVGISAPAVTGILQTAPFFEQGLGWALPALIGAAVGYLLDRLMSSSSSQKASFNEK
ncbi:branched-chain amino acid transport system II carrier protein [Marinococcus halophilus]|uniref:branched-chain amino acid transport system II carrier protein n=1 Tax=Marinococcus halophilus TaxID=1371 RepID=UPI0009A68BFB|nr:branched-chain amino acid transport system II carrier protein [Marinococcus halophilus]